LGNVNNLEDISWILKFNLPITLDTSHLLLGQASFGFEAQEVIKRLSSNIVHWHISDAAGLDGEGLPIGEGGIKNEQFISGVIDQIGIKVIEVWQGHFYNYEGFKVAINKIAELKGKKK
jgi:N-acetylneuraminate synthase